MQLEIEESEMDDTSTTFRTIIFNTVEIEAMIRMYLAPLRVSINQYVIYKISIDALNDEEEFRLHVTLRDGG